MGGGDTIVCGAGWKKTRTTQCSAHIKGFADDLHKRDIPIISAVTAVDLPEGMIILEANKLLHIPDNTYTILSAMQLREHGIQVNDVSC